MIIVEHLTHSHKQVCAHERYSKIATILEVFNSFWTQKPTSTGSGDPSPHFQSQCRRARIFHVFLTSWKHGDLKKNNTQRDKTHGDKHGEHHHFPELPRNLFIAPTVPSPGLQYCKNLSNSKDFKQFQWQYRIHCLHFKKQILEGSLTCWGRSQDKSIRVQIAQNTRFFTPQIRAYFSWNHK